MRTFLVSLVSLFLGCSELFAATLNFASLPSGPGPTKQPLRFATAEISTVKNGSLFVYDAGQFDMPGTGGFCALGSSKSTKEQDCTGRASLVFAGPVSNLSFKGYFAELADRATITAYAGNELLGFMLVTGNANNRVDIDLSGVSGITRLEIESLSGNAGRGIAYGDFNFNVDPPGTPSPPPLPPLYLNLDTLTGGINPGQLDLGPALLVQTGGGQIYVYRTRDYGMAQNGGFCALEGSLGCMGDFSLAFDAPITDLFFSGFFAKLTDSAWVSLFDGDTRVFYGRFSGNTGGTIWFDFRSVTKITKIMITDASSPLTKGIAYGDFRSRLYVPPAAVPVPAAVFLLAGSLLLLSLLRFAPRRRNVAA